MIVPGINAMVSGTIAALKIGILGVGLLSLLYELVSGDRVHELF